MRAIFSDLKVFGSRAWQASSKFEMTSSPEINIQRTMNNVLSFHSQRLIQTDI